MEYLQCFYFLIMQENNMTEIKRFNKERRHDLVEMLKGFVSDQVQALNFVTFFVFFSFWGGGCTVGTIF